MTGPDAYEYLPGNRNDAKKMMTHVSRPERAAVDSTYRSVERTGDRDP